MFSVIQLHLFANCYYSNSLPFNAPNAFLSTPTFTKYLLGEKKLVCGLECSII